MGVRQERAFWFASACLLASHAREQRDGEQVLRCLLMRALILYMGPTFMTYALPQTPAPNTVTLGVLTCGFQRDMDTQVSAIQKETKVRIASLENDRKRSE